MDNPIEIKIDDSILDKSIENIRASTNEQIAHLSEHKNTLSILVNDLNLEKIKKIHNAKKSYFGTATDWFADLTIWMKLLLGIVIIGMSILLSISIFVSISIYGLIAFIFYDHSKNTTECNNIIFDNIVKMQQSLAYTISHINEISLSLQKSMAALCELHSQMIEINVILQSNNFMLSTQLDQFKEIIHSLEINRDEFIVINNDLKTKLDNLYSQLNEHNESMSESVQSIHNVDIELGKTCQGFEKSIDQYEQSSKKYETLAIEYERLISILHNKINSLDNHPTNNLTAILVESQRVSENAERALDAYEKHNNHYAEPEEAEYRSRAYTV